MTNLSINPKFVSDTNNFSFKNVPTMYYGFMDVMYKGKRIAIINGLSAPLQWTGKNDFHVPIKVIIQLENMVIRLIKKSNKK